MISIDPAPRCGPAPHPTLERSGHASDPRARALPPPANAGAKHAPGLGDYIALGIGVAGLGALGLGAAEAAGATEGLVAGGAALAKNVTTAVKAFGPRLAERWEAGTGHITDAASFGRFAADQTAAAASDFARTAVIGGGLSAGATLARHVVHAVSHGAAAASANGPEAAPARSAPVFGHAFEPPARPR